MLAIISFVFEDFGSCEPFLSIHYINFIFYLIQSWTKIVGTLVHNSVVFLDSQFPSSPPPPFNLCCCDATSKLHRVITLQHWFRGVGSVNCPRLMAKIWSTYKQKSLSTLKRFSVDFFDFKPVTSTLYAFFNFKIIRAFSVLKDR